MTSFLVMLHVVAGSVAVVGMLCALVAEKGSLLHRRGGKAYVVGMSAALAAALIIAALTGNVFLLCIGIFSGYFVYTGWRLAAVRDGVRSVADRAATVLMLLVALLMVVFGGYMLVRSQSLGVALAIFGYIAALLAWRDYRRFAQWPKGQERIVMHLNRMGIASIATITAIFVANLKTDPALIAWLLPTAAGVPLLTYWTRRVGATAKN